MNDIIDVINNNPYIEQDLKDKIIECTEMILKFYPSCAPNLYKNLSDIIIEYKSDTNEDKLNKINANSLYLSVDNILILDPIFANSKYYKNLLIHELLHIASFHDDELGFQSLSSGYGVSLNEGMTEYLTETILNDYSKGMTCYQNDISNIGLLSTIIEIDKLKQIYFNGSFLDLLQSYIKQVGMNNNIKNLIVLMDNDYVERVRKQNFNNKYKDEYIKLFVEDVIKVIPNDNSLIYAAITDIVSYIRSQYISKKVPDSIKPSIESSINTLLVKVKEDKIK